jgi:hypothetical protein
MKKIILVLLTFLFTFSVVTYSQDATTTIDPAAETAATEELTTADAGDLQPPYVMECVTVGGLESGWPPDKDDVTFSGACSSSKGCDVGVCIGSSCTVFDAEKDGRYFGGGGNLPDVQVAGSTPHRFPPGQFTDLAGSIIPHKGFDHVGIGIFAVWEPEPLGAGGENNDPSQQLGQPKMEFPRGGEDCVSVYWDPYGRVFDAVSLEPLGDNEAKVSLYDQAGSFVNTPSNNTFIDNLGKYNIYLEIDGFYTLKVDSMANHDFVAVNPHANYTQLYEKLFKAGDPAFAESKTNPQRYDIPVKPKSTPYHREPEVIERRQFIVWNNGEEFNTIEFRVSHPRTKVVTNLTQAWVCEQTKSEYTDKEGFCLIRIKATDVPQEGIDIRYVLDTKYYPTSTNPLGKLIDAILSLFIGKVNAQQSIKIEEPEAVVSPKSEIHIDPILRFVEGFAYDKNNEAIPKAKVNVRLLNKSVFYSTTADDTGFFTIYRNNLPPLEFYLQYIDPRTGVEVIRTTSEFVTDNGNYLQEERINLMAGTKFDQPVIDPKTGRLNQIDRNYVPPTLAPTGTAAGSKSALSTNIFLIVFILLALFASLVGVALYIKKAKSSTGPY